MAERSNTLQYLIRACRSCLDTNFTDSVSLQDHDWLELYKYCANAEIPDEQLPRLLLCSKCAVTVKCFAEFKRKCAESEVFWNSLLKQNVLCKTTSLQWPLTAGQTVPLKIRPNASEQKLQNSIELVTETKMKSEFEDSDHGNEDKLQSLIDEVNTKPEIKSEFEDSDYENKDDTIFDDKLETNPKYFAADVEVEQKSSLTNIEMLNNVENVMVQPLPDKPIPEKEPKKKLNVKSKQTYKVITRQSASQIIENEKRDTPSVLKGKYTCDICGRRFSVKSNIILHIKQHSHYECGLCEYKAADAAAVNKHVVEHYTNNELRCRLCEYEGKDFACMVSHRTQHMDRFTKRLKITCVICGYVNLAVTSAEFHFRREHLNRAGGLCHICHNTYKRERTWKKHMLHMHTSGFWCKMKSCNYRYRTKEALEKHQQNHPSAKRHICDICGYACYKGSNLTTHIENVHTSPTVTCDVCGKKFKSNYLRSHMKTHQERPFKCPSCPKAYISKRLLKAHELQHTVPDSRPHKCDICGQKYRWKTGLSAHLAVHTGIPLKTCNECGEKFWSYTTYRRHKSKHTGIPLYSCTVCDKPFSSKGRLNKHVAESHA